MTDGESIYWRDGPRLMFDEIIEMLRKNNCGEE
jgi:aspartyl/asparaginyl beta-hydroxylase (cupin superfamily)